MEMMRLKVNESSINRFPIKKEEENVLTVYVIFMTFMVKIRDEVTMGNVYKVQSILITLISFDSLYDIDKE